MTGPTVALYGATGELGSHLLTAFKRANDAGKLKLIILHRPSSKTTSFPQGVETHVLDADNGTLEEVQAALKGVDILVNAAKQNGPEALSFVQKLAKTPSLKVYVPSYFTANWTQSEQDDAASVYIHGKSKLKDATIAAGVPTTTIANGLFEWAFLHPGFFGVDAANNSIEIYNGQKGLDSKFSFSSLRFLAEGVAQLVASSEFGPGQKWTLVEAEFNGHDVVAALEKVHGQKAKVTEFTEAGVQEMRKDPGTGLGAAWRMHWGKGNWNVKNLFEPVGIERRTLLQAVQDAAKPKAKA